MDLASKQLGWVLQTGKMTPPGLKGWVQSSFVLEVNMTSVNYCSNVHLLILVTSNFYYCCFGDAKHLLKLLCIVHFTKIITGGPCYMQTFYLQFHVYVIETMAFQRNVSSNLPRERVK